MKCPHCSYPGEQFLAHVYGQGYRTISCHTCKGTNEIGDEHARRIEIGKRLRQERVDGLPFRSIREAAAELGVRPSTLSFVESGNLATPEAIELWNRLTGESIA